MQVQLAKQSVMEVIGGELVSHILLGGCLELANVANKETPGHLRTLIFSTRDDMKEVGMYWPAEGKIEINLRNIVDQRMSDLMDNMSMPLSWHADYLIQVWLAMGHECGHALHRGVIGAEAYSLIDRATREKEADESADETLVYLASEFDIEPSKLSEEPYLLMRMQEAFVKYAGEEWVRREQRLLAQGLVYELNGNTLTSLRTFIHKKFADGQEWKQVGFPVRVEFHADEKGETKVMEPQVMGQTGTVLVFEEVDGQEGAVAFADDGSMPLGFPDVPGETTYAEADGGGDDNWHETGTVVVPPAVVPQTMNPAEVPIVNTGLQLPAHIAGLQQAGAAGAAAVSSTGRREYPPKQFPPNNHPAEKMIEFMAAVYQRLYYHIFRNCGWTGTAVGGAQDWHFERADAVVSMPVNITDLIHQYGMPDVIMEYNTHDSQGRKLYGPWAEKCTNGIIRGEIFKQTQMPGYTLYCNFYGVGYVRVLSPQNVNKTSKPALRAREGHMIAWAIAQEKPEGQKMVGGGEDGKWTIIR